MNEGSLSHKRMVRKITSLQLQSAKDPDNRKIAKDAYLAYGKGTFKKGFRKNRAKKGSGDYEFEVGKHYIKKAADMKESKVHFLVELKRAIKQARLEEAERKKYNRIGKLGDFTLARLAKKFKGTYASNTHDAMQDKEDKDDEKAEDRSKDIKEAIAKRADRLSHRAAKLKTKEARKDAERADSKFWLKRFLKSKSEHGGGAAETLGHRDRFSKSNQRANEAKDELPRKLHKPTKLKETPPLTGHRYDPKVKFKLPKGNPNEVLKNMRKGRWEGISKAHDEKERGIAGQKMEDPQKKLQKESHMNDVDFMNYLVEKIMFLSDK